MNTRLTMLFAIFPFRYYKVLPDSALANRIRQKSWDLDNIFPRLKQRKSELRGLTKSITSNLSNIAKVRHSIDLLCKEIKAGVKDLKYINFYDSALLYLYFRLLNHAFGLCNKEKETSLKNGIKKNIKEHKKLIKKFDAAKKRLVEVYENLVKELRKRRWDAEKQAQHEFSLLKFTLRSMKNLNRKIKVEAIKVKTRIIPQKVILMRRIQGKKPEEMNPEDIIELAKLVSQAINRISKDVVYSSKLIAKFEKEMAKLKKIVENLKNRVNNLIKDEKKREMIIKNITKPWDDIVKNLEDEINKDLMEIFRNIFVLYKHVGTKQLKRAA